MKKLYFLILVSIISCTTFQKKDLEKAQKQFNQDNETQKNKIILDLYEKRKRVKDEDKDDYIHFFMNNPTLQTNRILMQLYAEPQFTKQKESITKYLFTQLSDKEVSDFLLKEIQSNPNILNQEQKEYLYSIGTKNSAEFILNLIYLEKLKLEPANIEIFKKTNLKSAISLLASAVDKNQYVEESFDAIANIRSSESDDFLVSVSSDVENPYRHLGLSYLHKIEDKNIAYNIYTDVIKNYKEEDKQDLFQAINGIKKMMTYLNKSQIKELSKLLKKVQTENPQISETISHVQQQIKNQENVSDQNNTQKESEQSSIFEDKQTLGDKKETTPNSEESSKDISHNQQKEPIPNKKLDIKGKDVKKNLIKNKKKEVKKQYEYSKKYVNNLTNRLTKIYGNESKKILLNFHNSLLTYAKSHSEASKFVIMAYKIYYKLNDENEIRNMLNKGIYLENSLQAILNYINNQYDRNDLKIFNLTQTFNLKRKHAEIMVKNIKNFL